MTSDRFNNVWNKAFKRQVILNSKRYEDVSFLNVEEDFLMQLPWYDTAKNAVYIPMNLYRYRFNPNSVTNMKFNDQLFNMAVFLLAETFPYFEKWKVPNPEIICNRQFFSRVSGALKQFYLKGSGLSKCQKKKYLWILLTIIPLGKNIKNLTDVSKVKLVDLHYGFFIIDCGD